VAAALEAGDHEQALELLLESVRAGDDPVRQRLGRYMIALFGDLGADNPVSLRYRRQLASTLN
jgi:thioredoxin-like negative regulator of GroEL